MKRILIIGCLFLVSVIQAQQAPFGATYPGTTLKLYMSKQTGEYTCVQGTYTKVSDEFESGTCALSTIGPVQYTLDKSPNYGPNQTKTWNGSAKPDVANGPSPGTSQSAAIKGDYNVFYSKPGTHPGVVRPCNGYYVDASGGVHDPHGCGGFHTVVNDIGTGQVNYEIISVKIDLPDSFICDGLATIRFYADLRYPEGGSVQWFTPAGVFGGNEVTVPYNPAMVGKRVFAKYTVSGVSYTDSATIKRVIPEISLPEYAPCVNGIANITATCNPPFNSAYGSIVWTTPEGTPCSGPTCSFEVNPALPPEKQWATAVYIYKCETSAPDSSKIKLNRLTGFELPCCVDTLTPVADIAKLTFDGPCAPKVKFDPPVLDPASLPLIVPTKTVMVKAITETVTLEAPIVLVNPHCSTDTLKEIVNAIKEVKKKIDKILDIVKEIEKLTNPKKGGPAAMPCKLNLTGDEKDDIEVGLKDLKKHKNDTLKAQKDFNINFKPLCCKTDTSCKVSGGMEIKGSIGYGASIDCKFNIPIPYVPPIVATFTVGVSAGVKLSVGANIEANCPPTKMCITGEALMTLGGTIGIEVLKGGVSADVGLKVKDTGAEVSLCYSYPPSKITVPFKAKFGGLFAVGTVYLGWGAIEIPVMDYPIIGPQEFVVPDLLSM